jgi:alpha-1,3/alpha-1,6-mannosyltransferase
MLQVRLLPSFSHDTKGMLLAAATAVLYTPTDEHFGIVPLEVIRLQDGPVCHYTSCAQ